MNRKRFARAGGVLALTGAALTPALAAAAPAAGTAPSGTASAATVSITVSPRALLGLPSSVLSLIPNDLLPLRDAVNGVVGGITIGLDAANATATLTQGAGDLATAHATSTAAAIDLHGVGTLLTRLQQLLQQLTGMGALTALPQLAPQLAAIQQQASTMTAPITALLSALQPQIALNETLVADLAGAATGTVKRTSVVSLPAPVALQLAPFSAVAVNSAGAAANGLPGARAEGDNTTESLDIGPSLHLAGVDASALSALVAQVQQLVTSLGGLLQQVPAGSTALQQALGAVSSTPLGALTNPVAQSLGGGQSTATQAVQQLQGDLATLQQLLTHLTALQQLNGALGQVDLNRLVHADGSTATALVEPHAGGVHALATSNFVDLRLLQVVSDQLVGRVPGLVAGTPLVELRGVQSSADALVDGHSTAPPTGTTRLAELDVLGHAISLDSVLAPGTQQSVAVPVGALGTITVQLTRGVPQTVANTPERKQMQVSALDVRILNGDYTANRNGANPVAALGGTGGAIADVPVANVAVDAQTTGAAVAPLAPPETGGPGLLAVVPGVLLGALGVALRVLPGRRRRRGDAPLT